MALTLVASTLCVTSLHAKASEIMAALSAVTKRFKELAQTTATQLAYATNANDSDHIISSIFDPLINSRAGPAMTINA